MEARLDSLPDDAFRDMMISRIFAEPIGWRSVSTNPKPNSPMDHEPQTSNPAAMIEFARDFPFFKLIGLEILAMKPGWSKTRIRWRHDLTQPAGIMHGGIIAALIDTGIAHALTATEMFQELFAAGGSIVSVDLRVKYLRPVSEGAITCESKIPRLGRHIIHGESIVANDEGKEVARGDSIYMAIGADQLKQRNGETQPGG